MHQRNYTFSYFLLGVAFPSRIPLEPVYEEGYIPPTAYNVVKDGEFKGEIKIGLAFTPHVVNFTIKVVL